MNVLTRSIVERFGINTQIMERALASPTRDPALRAITL
jgi:hypothetical protein